MNTWPDGAMTPFRSEKNTNWEGAFRVPCLVRWPGHIKPGTITNQLMSHNDWIPTLCCHRGRARYRRQVPGGLQSKRHNYKVHLDGYDQSKFLTAVSGTIGNANDAKSAATSSSIPTTTVCSWPCGKAITNTSFPSSAWQGTMGLWAEPFTTLRLQKIFNVMMDPFERADITSNTYWDWQLNHVAACTA